MIDYIALMDLVRLQCRPEARAGFDKPCLRWEGPTNGRGEGWLRWRGNSHNAVRAAWRYAYGPTDEGREIIQACGDRTCCEPSHLLLKTEEGAFVGVPLA